MGIEPWMIVAVFIVSLFLFALFWSASHGKASCADTGLHKLDAGEPLNIGGREYMRRQCKTCGFKFLTKRFDSNDAKQRH